MDSMGIGMLGFGSIGKVHALAYREIPSLYPSLPGYHLAAVCTNSPETAQAASKEGGFARGYSRIRDLLADPNVTVVDCVLPNHAHTPAILECLAAGKPVYCEKPLALSSEEARELAAAARMHKTRVGMTFNYRFLPAILKARQLCQDGALGEVYGFHFEYLHGGYQDATRPLTWRMRRESSGGGALVDLGAHAIDLIRHLLGEIVEVLATTKTFITERPVRKGSAEKGPVTVDDAAWVQVRLASGAVGTLEVSRFATGSADDLRFRIEGSRGALKFDLMDANWLYFFDAERRGDPGWIRLETIQSYPGAAVPPARSIVGWDRTHAENAYRFLKSVFEGAEPDPGITDGVWVHLVTDAAYASAAHGGWVPVGTP